MDGIEEVHARDALWLPEVRRHLRHGQRRRVRCQDACIPHDTLELCEHLLLDRQLLEHGLQNEVAVGEGGVGGLARDERGEKAALVLVVAALRNLAVDLGSDVAESVLDDLLLHVTDHDRHFEPEEERRDLPRHQAGADDPDLPDLLRRGHRTGGMLLRPLLHELEGIEGRLRLRTCQQLADGVLFAPVSLLDRPFTRAGDQFERSVRSGRGAVHRVVGVRARPPEGPFRVRPVRLTALKGTFGELACEGQRLVEELGRLEEPVDDLQLRDLGRAEHAVLA